MWEIHKHVCEIHTMGYHMLSVNDECVIFTHALCESHTPFFTVQPAQRNLIFLQETGLTIISMDALFGLPRKRVLVKVS